MLSFDVSFLLIFTGYWTVELPVIWNSVTLLVIKNEDEPSMAPMGIQMEIYINIEVSERQMQH